MKKRHGEGDGDGIDRKWGVLTFSILGVLLRLVLKGAKAGSKGTSGARSGHRNGNGKVDVTASASELSGRQGQPTGR